jgi:hypothetical protein
MGAWLDQMFQAAVKSRDGIVRRQKPDVRQYASFEDLLKEVRRRGWHLIEAGDQYIVICNETAVVVHC